MTKWKITTSGVKVSLIFEVHVHKVGWRDLAFFSICENLHISAAQSFHFQKITETLKINIYV